LRLAPNQKDGAEKLGKFLHFNCIFSGITNEHKTFEHPEKNINYSSSTQSYYQLSKRQRPNPDPGVPAARWGPTIGEFPRPARIAFTKENVENYILNKKIVVFSVYDK
jgi:hypothetical protein